MTKGSSVGMRIINKFFTLTMVTLLLFYMRWFRIAPFQFSNESTPWLIIGLVLLTFYIVITKALPNIKERELKIFLYLLNFPLLCAIAWYLAVITPHVITSASCNGNTYYVTSGPFFSDPRLTYVQWAKWSSIFHYETEVLGFDGGAHANEIVCDVGKQEAHFIRHSDKAGFLVYIDGPHPQDFDYYATDRLKNKLYFLAEDWIVPSTCNPKQYWDCDIYVHTLYECDLDYLNCNALPATYTHHSYYSLDLRADEEMEEISLVKLNSGNDDEMIIFTYGKTPRCYVTGCKIGTAQQGVHLTGGILTAKLNWFWLEHLPL